MRKRSQFLAVAQGPAERRRTVVVQVRLRQPLDSAVSIGFTATRKIGNATVRNRARRRLREAVRLALPRHGVPGADYVFIARQDTAQCAWTALLDDIENALVSLARRLGTGEDAGRTRLPPSRKPKA